MEDPAALSATQKAPLFGCAVSDDLLKRVRAASHRHSQSSEGALTAGTSQRSARYKPVPRTPVTGSPPNGVCRSGVPGSRISASRWACRSRCVSVPVPRSRTRYRRSCVPVFSGGAWLQDLGITWGVPIVPRQPARPSKPDPLPQILRAWLPTGSALQQENATMSFARLNARGCRSVDALEWCGEDEGALHAGRERGSFRSGCG